MSFQSCVSFFLMLNIKEDILKNAGIKHLMVPLDFHSIYFDNTTMEINGDQLIVNYLVLQNIFICLST